VVEDFFSKRPHSSMPPYKPYLQRLVDRETELPSRCDNGWTRTLLVLASIWVAVTAYARSCQVATRCTSTYGAVECTPFTLGGSLSACSVRACALKSKGSNNLAYMSKVLSYALDEKRMPDAMTMSATSATSASNDLHSNSVYQLDQIVPRDASTGLISRKDGGALLQNPQWLRHIYGLDSSHPWLSFGTETDKLRAFLNMEEQGSCKPGQVVDAKFGRCVAAPTTPKGLVQAAMDFSASSESSSRSSASSLEQRACGQWSAAIRKVCVGCPRQYFTLQNSPLDEDLRWHTTYQRLQLRGGSRTLAGVLMDRCIALRQEGTPSIAANIQLSYKLLLQRLAVSDSLQTVGGVLNSIGELSSYGCNSLVRVGTSVGLQGVSVQVANMDPPVDIVEALRLVNEQDALRKSLVMQEVLDWFPRTTNDNGLPMTSIWEGSGLTTTHRAKYDACYIEKMPRNKWSPSKWHMEKILRGVRGVDLKPSEKDLFENNQFGSLVHLRRLLCLLSKGSPAQSDEDEDFALGPFANEVATAVVQSTAAMCVRSMGEALHQGLEGLEDSTSPSLAQFSESMQLSTATRDRFASFALGRVHPEQHDGEHALGLPPGMNTTRFEGDSKLSYESMVSQFGWNRPSVVVIDWAKQTELQTTQATTQAPHPTEQRSSDALPDVFDSIMRSPTEREYEKSALVTVDNAASQALSMLAMGSANDKKALSTTQCGAIVSFVAPMSMDRAAFEARFTNRVLRRLEALFASLRSQMVQVVRDLSSVFVDVPSIEDAFSTVRVSIPGATPADSVQFGGQGRSGRSTANAETRAQIAFETGLNNVDGVLMNMLDSGRATKREMLEHAVSDEVKDPCELPPLYDAQLVNAYYMYPSNCIVMFLGLATDSVLNDAYDDATLLSRYGWVLAHELAHASVWSRRYSRAYGDLLQHYTSSAREEGLADFLATVATTKAAGHENAYTTLLNVAQVFCVSDIAPPPFGNAGASHPSPTQRASKACRTIQDAYLRGLSRIKCVPEA